MEISSSSSSSTPQLALPSRGGTPLLRCTPHYAMQCNCLACAAAFHHCCLHVPSEPAASSSAAHVTHEIRHVQISHVTQPMYLITW